MDQTMSFQEEMDYFAACEAKGWLRWCSVWPCVCIGCANRREASLDRFVIYLERRAKELKGEGEPVRFNFKSM